MKTKTDAEKARDAEIEKRVEALVKEELTPIDTEAAYRDMLDECYSFKSVGGIFANMSPARVLEEVDPVAYRCGKNDYEDSLREQYAEIDEDFYNQDEVDKIREDVTAEVEDEEAEAEANADEDSNETSKD